MSQEEYFERDNDAIVFNLPLFFLLILNNWVISGQIFFKSTANKRETIISQHAILVIQIILKFKCFFRGFYFELVNKKKKEKIPMQIRFLMFKKTT